MAVYKRSYQRYEGPLTPAWRRFIIPARYAYQNLFRSRVFTLFFWLCLLPPILSAGFIYLHHNLTVLDAFRIPINVLLPINAQFFMAILSFQGSLAFLLAAFAGPGLVSPDLVNNALPLYLSRPFSRGEYVIGKLTVLAALQSFITWLPGLLLFLLQSHLEGIAWMTENGRIAAAIFFGSWAWILTISLLALALSAWVKWKPVAGGLLFVVFFAAAGFGEAINQTLFTSWGSLINLQRLLRIVWSQLFLGDQAQSDIPVWSAGMSLLAICAICILLLMRKIRAYEVVRS